MRSRHFLSLILRDWKLYSKTVHSHIMSQTVIEYLDESLNENSIEQFDYQKIDS